ncbi:MAG TPA: KR domain-containing protein, partial [Ktedonobacteraceae bacterium]|nr:KR domain-containing protein [Ktedonobacteraceae bacterium]
AGRFMEYLVQQLMHELVIAQSETVVAYRGQQRWVQRFTNIHQPAPSAYPGPLHHGAVYLISGGLSNINFEFAKYLARHAQARFIVIDQPPRPNYEHQGLQQGPGNHQEQTNLRLGRLLELESLGAEAAVISASNEPEADLQAAIAQAHAKFGRLDGVIYEAADHTDLIMPIKDTDYKSAADYLQDVTRHLNALAQSLQHEQFKHCILTSSLSSLLGGLGLVTHAAVHLLMDAFAKHAHTIGCMPWLSINWDAWQFGEPQERKPGLAPVDLAITPAEGDEVFQSILQFSDVPQLAVSTGDFQQRLNQWTNSESLRGQTHSPEELQDRPQIGSPYVAPQAEAEQNIVKLWQDLLGIKQIGIHDDFFELGGNSLLGTQLISRLRQMFQVDLSLRTLFEAPTVAELAISIEEMILDEISAIPETDLL